MGIEHRAAVQGQALAGRQVDTADPFAAGVHSPGNPQAAVVHRDVDGAGPDPVADGQVALLELEAACAKDLALVQALVEGGELLVQGAAAAQVLGLDFHRGAEERHQGAAGVVVAAAAAKDLARQVYPPGRTVQRHRPQLAGLVMGGRKVDGRARGLQHIAGSTLQQHFAAGAVFAQVIEGDGAASHIDQRRIGQADITPGPQGHLAAGQHHGTGQADAVALQRQFRTLAIGLATRAGRGADIHGAASSDAVHRAGLAGHQWGEDIQVAAAVGKPLERIEGALALVDRQAALVVGGNALAGIEVDVGKTQGQAVETLGGAGLGKGPVAELDAFGIDLQAAAAGSGTAGHHRACRGLGTLPDQVGGVDAGHIIGAPGTVDRRGGEHQVAQQRLAGRRVVGVQAGAAVEVEAVPGRELQGLQGRGAELGIAAQQAVEQLLGQGHAAGQAIARRRCRQRLRAADVDVVQAQVQVAGAVAHLVTQLEGVVGQGNEAAIGIQCGLPAARRAGAHPEPDAAAGLSAGLGLADHVEQAVGHRQHIGHLVGETVTGVIAGLASAQGIDRSALLQDDLAGVAHQEHFRRGQGGALAQGDRALGRVHAFGHGDVVAALAVLDQRQAAQHQARCAHGVEAVGIQGNAVETLGGRLAGRHHFDVATAHVQHRDGAAIAPRSGVETANALEREGIRTGPRLQGQLQGLGVHRQHRPWHPELGGIGQGELGIAGFVVLGIAAQGIGRGQDQLAGDAVADPGMGDR